MRLSSTIFGFALAALSVVAPVRADQFPVTLTHQFGVTTVPAQPKRVVTVGVHEQDFLYALGVAPVGVHEWFNDYPYATWPWAEAARKALNAEPAVLKGFEINMEWVAAQKPDLIIATYYGDLDTTAYGLLSAIAPTIASPAEFPAWGIPWQDELQIIGKATGTSRRAAEVEAELTDRFAATRNAYPMLAGKSAAVGYYYEGAIQTFNAADTSHRFLQSLGMTIPASYDEQASARGSFNVSMENLDLIELDAFVFPDGRKEVDAISVYQNTRLHREGRDVSLDGGVLAGALSFQSPLALEYLLDRLPPMLAAAVDGNPATPIPAAQ